MKPLSPKGFTLIELLIVVAIIAILAAIAVPNFLEAQTRSKVTRTKSDMRTLALAMEAYSVDNNGKYSSCAGNGQDSVFRAYANPPRSNTNPVANLTPGFELTTPIAYISNLSSFNDVFKLGRPGLAGSGTFDGRQYVSYVNWALRNTNRGDDSLAPQIIRDGAWAMWSAGPDRYVNNNTLNTTIDYEILTIPLRINYDASNGTVSVGDIYRTQKFSEGIKEQENPPTP